MVINVQDDILRLQAMGLLDRLLQDKATGGNILWATDAYSQYGEFYSPGNEIRSNRITGECSDLIKTRARRAMEQRTERTRQHAEVFTPLWIVKKMNDFADERWFDRKTGIYKLTEDGKICFGKKKHWKRYVDARRLEITCGEAPFLATRYDVETGEAIPIADRIGLLDRKLRVVTENALDLEEWKSWALRAVQSIYGYELQGDNLLIARVNVLFTMEEHMFRRWQQKPEKPWLEKLCNVIAWNLWQMDGIRGCVPVPPAPTEEQLSLFPPIDEQTNLFGEMETKDIPCRMFDWRGDHSISYSALRKKGSELMKFDFIIGNPPYQSDVQNQGDRANPIYDKFMDESYRIADKVELIHPARFLFNAGQTAKEWNKKMLSDPHFKVLWYEPNSSKVFSNTDIMGGIAVSYRNKNENYGAIYTFTSFSQLTAVIQKVTKNTVQFMDTIVASQGVFRFSDIAFIEHPEIYDAAGKGTGNKIISSYFENVPSVFTEEQDGDRINMIGRIGSSRTYRTIYRRYVQQNEYINKYKVFLPEANGSGAIGEVIPTPLIGEPTIGKPGMGTTDTFLCVGKYDNEIEATATMKYLKTRFARALLGVKKVTQHNPKATWSLVPLQDFSSSSDIDWSKSIPEIDQQLYKKYGLDDAEIDFIESHIKEMC